MARWPSGLVLRDITTVSRHSNHGFETQPRKNFLLSSFDSYVLDSGVARGVDWWIHTPLFEKNWSKQKSYLNFHCRLQA